jgi:hypothetical protein
MNMKGLKFQATYRTSFIKSQTPPPPSPPPVLGIQNGDNDMSKPTVFQDRSVQAKRPESQLTSIRA